MGGVGAPVRNTGPSTEARTGLGRAAAADRAGRVGRRRRGNRRASALISLPFAYAEFQDVCAAGVTRKPYWRSHARSGTFARTLQAAGLSTAAFAAVFQLAVEIACTLSFVAVGLLILWRPSRIVMGLVSASS